MYSVCFSIFLAIGKMFNFHCDKLEFVDNSISSTFDMAQKLSGALDAQFEANVQYMVSSLDLCIT